MRNTIEFKEVQGFRIWWAWLGVAALNGLFICAVIQQLIRGKPFGSKPAPDLVLILVEFFLLVFLFILLSLKLKTRINDNGIYYRFYPFQFKETFIAWHELKDAYMREYNSFYEYGGWGIRIGSSKVGKAINTTASGKTGLQLKFNNGKLLLIGTRRPDEIQAIINEMISTGKINRGV
ncbi:MAG TPA: DUF6141 family protein [Ferruginibacter sp.]|nr:DUF6141 family protein [Ferruginibacter sp.]